MKKTLLALIAFVGIFSSCNNDDITISRSFTFKVNPTTVVDNLFEAKAGDLTSLTGDNKLIVSLYIYNEKGELVSKTSDKYSAYTQMMTKDIDLPSGQNYTAVATTHVTSNVNFWVFSGEEQLSTFKIKDNGYIGGKSKILGLSVVKFTAGNQNETININVENAGAVAWVWFKSWNNSNYTSLNINEYALMSKKSCDYISFDNSGNKDYSLESENTYNFFMAKFEYDSSYSGASAYFFTFPIKNASFRFYAIKNNEYYYMGEELVDDIILGHSYAFMYDFDEDKATAGDVTPESSRSNPQSNILEKFKILRNEHINYNYEEGSISIR